MKLYLAVRSWVTQKSFEDVNANDGHGHCHNEGGRNHRAVAQNRIPQLVWVILLRFPCACSSSSSGRFYEKEEKRQGKGEGWRYRNCFSSIKLVKEESKRARVDIVMHVYTMRVDTWRYCTHACESKTNEHMHPSHPSQPTPVRRREPQTPASTFALVRSRPCPICLLWTFQCVSRPPSTKSPTSTWNKWSTCWFAKHILIRA